VQAKGGFEHLRVNRRKWKSVLQDMALPDQIPDVAEAEKIYKNFLQPCEGRSWNTDEFKQAETVAKQHDKVTITDLLSSRLVQPNQRVYWIYKDKESDATIGPHPAVFVWNAGTGYLLWDGKCVNPLRHCQPT
jgi:hypothetical protein